jgi:predicted PhzF superfamily epimerase YddE/YHI9
VTVTRAAIVDAFTSLPFTGNPAGVVLLDVDRPPQWMQSVAFEIGLSETAFLRSRSDGDWDLRWFTPSVEVALCGHATLASAHWLWQQGDEQRATVVFHTRSGELIARREDGRGVALDFPRVPVTETAAPEGWQETLPGTEAEWLGTTGAPASIERNALVLTSVEGLRSARPDFAAMRGLPVGGVIVTAESDQPQFDFMSRYFAPACGIDEDPVTGSAHCTLSEYWGPRLGRDRLHARQESARGGQLDVVRTDGRVLLVGEAVTTAELTLTV